MRLTRFPVWTAMRNESRASMCGAGIGAVGRSNASNSKELALSWRIFSEDSVPRMRRDDLQRYVLHKPSSVEDRSNKMT